MEKDVRGRPWIATLSFDTSGDFCDDNYKFVYNGRNVEIKRGGVDSPHNIFIEASPADYSAVEAVFKFFSELSWLFDERVEYDSFIAGYGKNIIGSYNKKYSRVGNSIDLTDYEPLSLDERQRLALSIYREGLNSSSKYYAFLCFYKIINITNHTRKELINWINDSYNKIETEDLSKYISENSIQDIGEHLYVSGRCAIAHASYSQNAVIRNADNHEDMLRIDKEVRFIKQFARFYLINDLKIPTRRDVASIVLLKYFNKLFKENLIYNVINSISVDIRKFPEIPPLKLGIHKCDQLFDKLTNIKAKVTKAGSGTVVISNEQDNSLLYLKFEIDFINKDIHNESLIISIRENVRTIDVSLLIDYFNLWKALLINGRLEIMENENSYLMTRLWPYIPVNIDVNASIANYEHILQKLRGGGKNID